MIREDWTEVNITEIISDKGIFLDGDWIESKDQDPNGDVRLIQLADIGDGIFVNKSNRFLTCHKADELNCTFLKEGDILVARMPYPLGRATIFPLKGRKKYVTAVDVAIIRFENKNIINKFFLYNFNSPSSRANIKSLQTGTTRKRISRKNLAKIKFPLAPLPEQRAIVEKIEQLLSELDNGIANLKKAKGKLEVYRESVLKTAFEGDLTHKWRKKKSNLPSADELLVKIKEERTKHYEQQLKEWKQDVKTWEISGREGKKPSKPKKVKELPDFTREELSKLSKIPSDWNWVKIDEIQGHNSYSIKAGPFGSSLKKSFYVDEGYKIYGQEQVIAGDWKVGDYYIDKNKYQELKSCSVQPKDVLISLVGTIGKVLILPDDIKPGIINPRLIKITLAEKFYSPKFFKYYFESAYLKSLYATKSHGATMDILNLSIIRELPFPLLSLDEQNQIIQEIETRLSVCDNILANIESELNKAELLRQSILNKAFEGKLLNEKELNACRREPDWEPAEKLLERIKQERNEEV